MRILITGAYGFVGTNLCRHMVERGHVCDALDIPAARREDVPYAAFHSWDEVGAKGGGLKLASYDAVVHLSGKAHDMKKVASERSYFEINVGLTKRIFDAFVATHGEQGTRNGGQGRTFIYFSSSKADANGNAYGRSKLAAEEYLSSAVRLLPSTSPLRVVILRPAMIHGPGNKGNLNLLWGIARRGLPWPLAAFENKRSFTAIGNICAVVEALAGGRRSDGGNLDALRLASGIRPSTYFVADDEMLSTNRLIELIAEACGRKAKLWRLPKGLMTFAAKAGDVCRLPLNSERLGKLTEDSFVDNAALKEALGWKKMPVEAETGMRLTLASFQAR